MPVARPRIVLLTGEPGSGKTTLGLALSAELGVPFVARDDVRRAIWFTSGSLPSRAAGTESFLAAIESLASLGITCIAEYVVRAAEPEHLARLMAAGDCVVVHVSCDDPVARRTARGADELQEAHMRTVAAAMRTDFPLPVLPVRTDEGYEPTLDAIAAFAVGGRP